MYSSWTDGSVDGHRSGSGGGDKATTGMAIITGDDPFNLTLSGVSTYVESTLPYQGRYPSLNYFRDGVWYCASGGVLCKFSAPPLYFCSPLFTHFPYLCRTPTPPF